MEYLTLGSTPVSEKCAQVGTEDYEIRARAECKRYIELLRELFGKEPMGARLAVNFEVVIFYNDDKEAVNYAYKLENECPRYWNTKKEKIELDMDSINFQSTIPSQNPCGTKFPNPSYSHVTCTCALKIDHENEHMSASDAAMAMSRGKLCSGCLTSATLLNLHDNTALCSGCQYLRTIGFKYYGEVYNVIFMRDSLIFPSISDKYFIRGWNTQTNKLQTFVLTKIEWNEL